MITDCQEWRIEVLCKEEITHMAMKILVLWKKRSFQTGRATTSSSRHTLVHQASAQNLVHLNIVCKFYTYITLHYSMIVYFANRLVTRVPTRYAMYQQLPSPSGQHWKLKAVLTDPQINSFSRKSSRYVRSWAQFWSLAESQLNQYWSGCLQRLLFTEWDKVYFGYRQMYYSYYK